MNGDRIFVKPECCAERVYVDMDSDAQCICEYARELEQENVWLTQRLTEVIQEHSTTLRQFNHLLEAIVLEATGN